MGLLSSGTPLAWEDSKAYIQHVKQEGIKQFIHIYKAKQAVRDDVLKWGDEVEYTIIVRDADGHYKLQCAAPELLKTLNAEEADQPTSAQVLWHPEYSNWQVEGTPAAPYRCYVTDLLLVEPNMALRRSIINKCLGPEQRCATLTNMAMVGAPGFLALADTPNGPVAQSRFMPDSIINPHPRYVYTCVRWASCRCVYLIAMRAAQLRDTDSQHS